jgi:prepilin-type N-terminal cleavage/methylation domain-containing protein
MSTSESVCGPRRVKTFVRACGFTLIELLIVISILGVLAAVLLPAVLETGGAADEGATQATMLQLSQGCQNFNRANGYYPLDDLSYGDKSRKATWKADNNRNTGIESLVCMLSQSKKDGLDLTELAAHFVNTDADDHGVDLPLLRRRDRLEIADAWGTPLAYFHKLGMDRPQMIVPGAELDAVQVKAKRRADGTYYGMDKFQLLSAGKDLTFGTEDDLVYPAN